MPIKQFGVDYDPAATPLSGTETVSIVQGGVTVDATTQDIADLAAPSVAVESVVAGTGISVDATDPANPIVSVDNAVTAATSTSGVLTIDCAASDYFTHALDENVTSWSITNLPGSGKGATKMIRFTQDSTPRTVAWPASFLWAGGTDGVVSTGSGAVDVLAITTFDNGTTWIATLANAFS
jgi:hypothetical protein